jgi:hypothetical protein
MRGGGEGDCVRRLQVASCKLLDLRATFSKPQTAEFQGRAGNHLVMLTKAQFLVSFNFKGWGGGMVCRDVRTWTILEVTSQYSCLVTEV